MKIVKKRFDEIFSKNYIALQKEARKNNIKLMLQNKEVKVYPYYIVINDNGEPQIFTEMSNTLNPKPAALPAQVRLNQIEENMHEEKYPRIFCSEYSEAEAIVADLTSETPVAGYAETG